MTYSLLVRDVQQILSFLGFRPGVIDGLLGSQTRSAIYSYQIANNLPQTGEIDPATLSSINGQLVKLGSAQIPEEGRRLGIVRALADIEPGSTGYDHTRLREDVAQHYGAARSHVLALGGKLTSAGGFRSLQAAVTAGRSSTSLHYLGRAFDLATDTGMQNPRTDRYLCVEEEDRFRVWCRVSAEISVDGVLAERVRLSACSVVRGRLEHTSVEAVAFDLTELLRRYGFRTVPRRAGFPEHYGSAEWWHFQYEGGLAGCTLGSELLRIYPVDSKLTDSSVWAHRAAVWRGGGGRFSP